MIFVEIKTMNLMQNNKKTSDHYEFYDVLTYQILTRERLNQCSVFSCDK